LSFLWPLFSTVCFVRGVAISLAFLWPLFSTVCFVRGVAKLCCSGVAISFEKYREQRLAYREQKHREEMPRTKFGLFSGVQTVGLVFLWPLFSTVWLLLKFSSGNPVSICLSNMR